MNADDPSVAQEVVGGSVCVRAQRFPSRVYPLFLARACLDVVNPEADRDQPSRPRDRGR